MCIKCDVTQFNSDIGRFTQDMAEALVDAFGIVKHMKARGIALDADEQKAYDKLLPFVAGRRDGEGRDGEGRDGPNSEGIADALKQAFPGAQVIIGSPDEVEAMLANVTKGKKHH